MTLGGIVRKCPSAAGKVPGKDFEYTLISDQVVTDGGETRRARHVKRVTASFEGQVKDDATLDYIEIVAAEYISERTGSPPERRPGPVGQRMRPGQYGEPDWDALERSVRVTGELAIAGVMWSAGVAFRDAQLEWMKRNKCVEFKFDPPTRTVMLGPGESAPVGTQLQAKIDSASVPMGKYQARALQGIGRVTPTEGNTPEESPSKFTYTASATPKRGHGFGVSALSRAGYGDAQWLIEEQASFEGSFSQRQEAAMTPPMGAGYSIVATVDYKTDGRLVWSLEPDSARTPTFGEVTSRFYVPTDGEITVKVDSRGKSIAGHCEIEGSRTFPVTSLPPDALKHLLLEVADDGRYRLTLRMKDMYLEFQASQKCSVRAAPGFPLPMAGGGGAVTINDAGILLGKQAGSVVDDTIFGRTAAPIVFGPISITGEWQFKRNPPSQP